ncbi:MAG: Animal haem peroxidase [uncultured Thermoleophilia bacterium]|uniref:Animal haem peroxidase n=1 Tax=uncultured Thermoleophilia bacterium TaxID=1497501 RepID=A0A6J4U0D0_9ACTN|nr:MAG: Animal haem peroxidase [uncultured Thermoleophilia bacterium]
MPARSTVRDGAANRVETYVTTHFEPVWNAVQRVEPVRRRVNRVLVNRAIAKLPTRPNPLSTKADYTSWDSLTDRRFDSRHLPPAPARNGGGPSVEQAADLFRRDGEMVPCEKSTVLFSYFAAWFTDGFLRSDRSEPRDMRRNDSNHEIDLTQLYGVRTAETDLLRTFEGGRLKSQILEGEEYPLFLCEGGEVKPEFRGLTVVRWEQLSREQRDGLFAMGSDTSNLHLGFLMLGVLFLREHNRLADALRREYPGWDDERLFGTARNILTVVLIKLVVDEYINHITPYHFRFTTDPTSLGNAPWMRPNWMAVEFNLLYRWHSMVPSTFRIGGRDVAIDDTLFNTRLLVERGLGGHFEDATDQPAGRVGLFNTEAYLRDAEVASIRQGREVRLASYND